MRSTALLSALLLALLALPALAEDEAAAPRTPLVIGDVVPNFELVDLDGKPFRLADARAIDEAGALAQVLAAAKAVAGGAEVGADTALADLPGLEGDGGTLDADKARAMLLAAGRPYGLMASPDAVEDIENLGDVVEWITDSAEAPLVFMCWSPMCPTSRRYEQRIQDLVAEYDARFYPLAAYSAKKERNEDTRAYVAEHQLPYRVLLDREQKATDIFGGKVTPHVFLLDLDNRLVYAGSIDDDPNLKTESADERRNWLADALEAVLDESPVYVQRTRAKG